MTEGGKRSRVASDPELYERIKSIVARYPNTTADDNADVLLFLRSGPMLDRALLSGVADMQPQLARFEADHRSYLALGPRQYFVAAMILIAVFIAGHLLWDIAL